MSIDHLSDPGESFALHWELNRKHPSISGHHGSTRGKVDILVQLLQERRLLLLCRTHTGVGVSSAQAALKGSVLRGYS